MDWIGNIGIVLGLWFVGSRKRYGFLLSMVGESAWIYYSLTHQLYSLTACCVVFFGLAIRGWRNWGKDERGE